MSNFARVMLFVASLIFGGGMAVAGSGCAYTEGIWHGCDAKQWRGWESEKVCRRLNEERLRRVRN